MLEHGSRDPDANVVWRGDGLIGVVYGVVSNRDRLSLSWGELFRGVVDDSRNVLARLDGPFALACLDADAGEVHLATDVAGSRPIYYAVGDGGDDEAGDGIDFASEVGPLLTAVDDPSLDPEAVSDLLLAGGVLGERTLVDGVASLPPATHLVFDGTVSTRRYWAPESAGLAPSGYPDRWLGAYRQALGDVAATTGDPSLWFPGDPGSRVAAAVLAERGCPVETLTCGGPDGGDRESASQVAAYLGLPNRQVHDDPDRHLVDAVADAVDATDAMVNWAAVDGLPYVTDRLHTDADALVFGRPHLDALSWAGTVCADDSPVGAVAENECVLLPRLFGRCCLPTATRWRRSATWSPRAWTDRRSGRPSTPRYRSGPRRRGGAGPSSAAESARGQSPPGPCSTRRRGCRPVTGWGRAGCPTRPGGRPAHRSSGRPQARLEPGADPRPNGGPRPLGFVRAPGGRRRWTRRACERRRRVRSAVRERRPVPPVRRRPAGARGRPRPAQRRRRRCPPRPASGRRSGVVHAGRGADRPRTLGRSLPGRGDNGDGYRGLNGDRRVRNTD
ncbi:hypothetical protein ACFQL4_08040 [Halosimplex aquaticum]